MESVTFRWLAGLRRAHVEHDRVGGFAQAGVTGLVWSPADWPAEDCAGPVRRLVADGARPDRALLWDLVVSDVREAAEAIRPVFRKTGFVDGFVAVWLDPDRLTDPGRAVAHARQVYDDAGTDNVAVVFAWSPARAGVVSGVVAAGIPVALSAAADVGAVAQARDLGMQRRRKEAEEGEEAEEVPVFLLGAGPAPPGEHLRRVTLVAEPGLAGPWPVPRLPATAEEEKAAFDAALAALIGLTKPGATPEPADEAPDAFARSVTSRCASLERDDVGPRLWRRDHTIWRDDPAEIADRLGWLEAPATIRERAGEIAAFARDARSNVARVVLLGMGGSSLAPEVLSRTLHGGVPLTVLDTTDPDHVEAVRGSLDLDRTLFVVSSKSGTTVETVSHLEYFWSLVPRGDRFVVVTDPGSPLAGIARERGFRHVFENPPDVGGRYSALTYFGLVPAALVGLDVTRLLDAGLAMARACAPSVPPRANPGLRLGAAVGDAQAEGRDKLTLVLPDALAAFGDWVEQLVAESLGKEGTGVVPVTGAPPASPGAYGDDRLFVAYAPGDAAFPAELDALTEAGHPVVRIRVPDAWALGGEFFRWEVATAVAGRVLGVHPFDQPDVESAKRRAREALESGGGERPEPGDARAVLAGLAPPNYLAVQAFIAPTPEHARRLEAVRARLRDRCRVATTLGFGPRFLHSTGQLHKGGPDTGRFLQVTGPHRADIAVPASGYTFGRLIDAQADGDLRALRDAGRPVARVTLEELEAL